MRVKNYVSAACVLLAAVLRIVSAEQKNSTYLSKTTCPDSMTANEFITRALALKTNWAETCCSLSWAQRDVMLEVQQAVTNGSLVTPERAYSPQFNLTILSYFNEYSVNWQVVKRALVAVFMVGADNPFASADPRFKNETLQLASRWVAAWKKTTREILPLVWLSSRAIELGKAPFSCVDSEDDNCKKTVRQLNDAFHQLADIFISVLFNEAEITTPGRRSWSSLNKDRLPTWSTNHSLFNAPWYCENGAPQTGVIAQHDVIGEKIPVGCLYPLTANTNQRIIDWGDACASGPR
jgi:hypothetical protein